MTGKPLSAAPPTSRVGLGLRPEHRVYAGFAIHALSMGAIFPRLPEIRDALGVGESALGLALIGTPVGVLASLTLASPLIDRIGFRRTLLASMPLVALFVALAVRTPTALGLFFALIPVGLLIGCVEIVLNVEADRTEAMVGRRIMNRAHAFWSIGFFATGLMGAGAAALGLSPRLHLALMIPLVAGLVAVLLGRFEPAPSRAAEEPAPHFALPSRPILVLVAVTLSALLMEGAGLDWAAITMTNRFASEAVVAGLAVAMLAAAQAGGRLVSDSWVERRSPASVARIQLWILMGGLVLLLVAPVPSVALVAFALLGFGTSAIFPLAMSAAAQRTDRPAPVNVAALAQIAFVAFLLGPPLLGTVAEHWGVRWVYGLGLPFVALSLWHVRALGERPGR